jgi:hypothetical protein
MATTFSFATVGHHFGLFRSVSAPSLGDQASAYLATVKAIVEGTLTPKITSIPVTISNDAPLV